MNVVEQCRQEQSMGEYSRFSKSRIEYSRGDKSRINQIKEKLRIERSIIKSTLEQNKVQYSRVQQNNVD